MKDETWLRELLAEEPLPDDGFAARVSERIAADAAKPAATPLEPPAEPWRRRWLGLAAAAVGAAIAVGSWVGLSTSLTLARETWAILALQLGLGLGGALWLDTESPRIRLPEL